MRRLAWAAVCLILLGCGSKGEPAPEGLDLEALLPESSTIGKFRVAEGLAVFTPDTLWEYLDGGAPRYQAYGFQRLVHVRYELGDDPLASVVADVFEMGSELGAFGVYSSIRTPGAIVRPWGAEGYRSGTVAAAWKGTVFVHAAADDDRPELIEMAESLVEQVCDGVVGETSAPTILRPLPRGGLVPRSERYVASDLLGHAVLPGGVLANYEVEGDEGELFFSELQSDYAAKEALTAFRREKERWSENSVDVIVAGHPGFQFRIPGAGSGTVIRARRFVVGVHGDLSFEAQENLLERLIDRLGD